MTNVISYASRKSLLAALKRQGVNVHDYDVSQVEGRFVATLRDAASIETMEKVLEKIETAMGIVPTPAPVEAPVAIIVPKAPTKKLQVLTMMENGGATVKDIARRLEINESAARSLVGDLRADKVSIVAMKIIGERGVMYHV